MTDEKDKHIFELTLSDAELNLKIPYTWCKRCFSLLLAGLVTVLGTFGLKVELRYKQGTPSNNERLL